MLKRSYLSVTPSVEGVVEDVTTRSVKVRSHNRVWHVSNLTAAVASLPPLARVVHNLQHTRLVSATVPPKTAFIPPRGILLWRRLAPCRCLPSAGRWPARPWRCATSVPHATGAAPARSAAAALPARHWRHRSSRSSRRRCHCGSSRHDSGSPAPRVVCATSYTNNSGTWAINVKN